MRTVESASEDCVRIQAELTRRNISIVATRENIDTREGSAATKFFRRSMLAQGRTKWIRPAGGYDWAGRGPRRRKAGGPPSGVEP